MHDELDELPVYVPKGFREILREAKLDVGFVFNLEVSFAFGLVHEGNVAGQKLVEKAKQARVVRLPFFYLPGAPCVEGVFS